jgi:hypothetical protein
MAASSGPEIINDGLVLCVDGANQKNSAKGFKNLLNLSTWTLGTGGVTGFSINGTIAENQRVLDTGPFGVSTVVWDTPSNDATSDADGGWDSSLINIDPTKMYRFSVWMRRKTIGNGSYYLGCRGTNSANTNEGVLNRSNGSVNTNAYFIATTWPVAVSAGDWMLIVGHVWPAGSGTGSVHENTGLWTTSGTKLFPITDFVWQATNVKTIHRSYLYYSTDITTNQQWYQPRIDLCDGTEPSVAELIAGIGSKWFDLSGNGNNGTFTNSPAPYNTSGYITCDGVDDYVQFPSFSLGSDPLVTINQWIYRTANFNTAGYWGLGGGSGNNGINGYTSVQNKIGWDLWGQSTFHTGQDYPLNQWVNVCWVKTATTFTTSTLKIYINGVEFPLNNTVRNNSSTVNLRTSFTVGRLSDNTNLYHAPGNIGLTQVYSRALLSTEVRQNFEAMRSRYGI